MKTTQRSGQHPASIWRSSRDRVSVTTGIGASCLSVVARTQDFFSASSITGSLIRRWIETPQQPGNAAGILEGSSLPDRREVIMMMSEYEERFRSPTPSLHQIFAAARGPSRERPLSRRIWVAVALVGVMMMTCKVASHSHRSWWDGLWLSNMEVRYPITC